MMSSHKKYMGPPIIDLVSDTEDDEPSSSTSTNLISPMDTGYLKVDLTRLAKMEKKGKLSHVTSFKALYHVLQSTGDSWLHDLQEPDWDKCIFTGLPGTSRPKAAELTGLQLPGNHVYFVGGAAVVEALLRTAEFFHFSDALIKRLQQCHPDYRPPPASLHASLADGVPTVSSLTVTSSSIDICCGTSNSEREELETFLQQPPIAINEPLSHPNKKILNGLPFYREFKSFQKMLRRSPPSSTLFQDFWHFYKHLKLVDSRWRIHISARNEMADSATRLSLTDETIYVFVRGNDGIPARDCVKLGVEDVDYFVGKNRLLQYCALRCLRLGDVGLSKAIAKVRKDTFYPDYVSRIDWNSYIPTSSASASASASASSSSSAQHTKRKDGASNEDDSLATARNLIRQLLEEFARPTSLPHPSDKKDVLFQNEFYHLHGAFQNGTWHVTSFMDLYLMLVEANDRWRDVPEQSQSSRVQRASKKTGYVVETLDPAAVRVYFRCFGARASEYQKHERDVDYFIGHDRLLQYVGMQTLQYGGLALASEIADIREQLRSGDYPFVNAVEAPISATDEGNTPPETRHRDEETQVNEDTVQVQQDATVLSKARPLSPSSSERSRKRRRQSASSAHSATTNNTTNTSTVPTQTQNGHGATAQLQQQRLQLQPPPLAPEKSLAINNTALSSLPQFLVMSDEDSDAIETQGAKSPPKPPVEPPMTADSKQVPAPPSLTRQRLQCSKSRDNRNLTFYDTK